jgi:multidrug efflux pump subunit AcrA (membrane-fusion protein)
MNPSVSSRLPGRLLLSALVAILLAGCNFGRAPAPTPIPLLLDSAGAMAGAPRTIYTVQRGAVVDTLSFEAKVSLDKMEDLFFGAPGRVQEVYVQSGESVELDQVIALLDTRVLELDRQAAVETLDLARQRLALAEANLRFATLQRELDLQEEMLRLKALQTDPDATALERKLQELSVRAAELSLQQLESGVEPGLEADVRRAEFALAKVEMSLADAQISAPFAGQVLLYDVLEKGKVVQAYTPVAALVDPQALVLEANLVPADLENLHEGAAVEIELSGALSASIPGRVRTLPQPFGTGAGPSTIIVPTSTVALGRLRPGLSVRIHAQRERNDSALWLPPDAIQGYKGSYFVRLQDGSERPVRVGIFAADRVEIENGLAFGEEVLGN